VGPTGTTDVEPQTFQDVKGSMGPLIDQGRPAATANDVVIGRSIADRIGAHIGDEVTVVTDGENDQTFVVTGIGRLTDGDETDLVFATTPDGQARIMRAGQSPNINGGFVRLGNDDAAARARLSDLGFEPATPPARIANLRQIGSVPTLLATALALLGLGGVIHGLLVAGDRRRGEIAVACALGFTRGQAAATIRWQGFTITAIAVVAGLPLGMVVGRLIWKQIADGVGAADLVTIPWAAIVVAPMVSVAVVTATASVIGRRVARLRTADVLRSE
jgi:ABC-type lipoprotein release transport system permease subunit